MSISTWSFGSCETEAGSEETKSLRQLSENSSSLQFVWSVEDSLLQSFKSAQVGKYFASDIFDMCGGRWQLMCYPNGNSEQLKGNVSLFLYCKQLPSFTENLNVNYLCTFNDDLCVLILNGSDFEKETNWGRGRTITNTQLQSLESLTIICVVQWSINAITGIQSKITTTQEEQQHTEKMQTLQTELELYKNNSYLRLNIMHEHDMEDPKIVFAKYDTAHLILRVQEYNQLFSKHEDILSEWGKNTNSLNDFNKTNVVNRVANAVHNDDEKANGLSLLEQNMKYNIIINEQSNRLNNVTTDDHLLQLLKKQNELRLLLLKAEEIAIDSKQLLDETENAYESTKNARINLQKSIEAQVNKLNELITKENELLITKKRSGKRNEEENVEICKLKLSREKCISLVGKYDEFVEINITNIDQANSYFKSKWKEFERKWYEWTANDIVSWFKHKTQSMNTSNIEWKEIENELIKQNICGKSLKGLTQNALYMIGIHDFGIRNFIFKTIVMLRSKSSSNDTDNELAGENFFPEKYFCPINKQIMSDPVIAFDAYTYERKAIEEYLKIHKKSPITNADAFTTTLFPNVLLQQEIILFNIVNTKKDDGAEGDVVTFTYQNQNQIQPEEKESDHEDDNKSSEEEEKDLDEKEEKQQKLEIVITDVIDEANDKLYFDHRPVRVHRWDDQQNKWRNRGTGKLCIYCDVKNRFAKIIYVDEKHSKTRLLQYINGDKLCKYCGDESGDCVEWYGIDYTMDNTINGNHLVGDWQVSFIGNDSVAKEFIQVFNNFIQANNNITNTSSHSSAATAVTAQMDATITLADNNQADDTLKSIGNLQQVDIDVETGHENNVKLQEYYISKLYRCVENLSKQTYWKNRASSTSLSFYQNKENGKIRMVCRENITKKLRLNQWIAPQKSANIEKKSGKQISWSAFDKSIDEEDKVTNNGYYVFAAEFEDNETADAFFDFFITASDNNEHLS